MTNAPSSNATRLHAWQHYLLATRQRRLLVWPSADEPNALTPIWQIFPGPHIWVGTSSPEGLPAQVNFLGLKQARTQLGREIGTLVVDARTQFDADAFGAVTGALAGGGVAILLMNPPHAAAPAGRFEQWCRQIMAHDADVLTITDDGLGALPPPPSILTDSSHLSPLPEPLPATSPWEAATQHAATLDQVRALEVLRGASQRALTVLTAPRGRGKSAALGLAIAAWLQEGDTHTLWLTAPRVAATDALFEHLQHHCPQGEREGNSFTLNGRTLQFIAPDALMEHLQEAEVVLPDILLVDEAAALPLPFLQRWLAVCPHVVLSTTLHGYEGSAQGFSHYLLQRYGLFQQHGFQQHGLQQNRPLSAPDIQHVELVTPIRWALDDPLEAFVSRLLCLDSSPSAQLPSGKVRIDAIDQAQLLANPDVLHQVFGLLVLAHYRTSPSDLQTLLDHPALTLWAAVIESDEGALHIVAVAMAFDEGGLPADLAQAVADGRRRPPGHLLPQTLALHSGWPAAAQQRWRRITRIAVHPQYQRRGIGSALLTHIYQCSQQQGIDLVGVSFGGKRSTLSFWQHNGFATVRVGLRDDTVTGERAVMMARACHPQTLKRALQETFWHTFPMQLAFELASLSPFLVAALLDEAGKPLPPFDDAERDAIRRFGFEKAPLASARPLLQRALLRYADALSLDECAVEERAAMAGVLLQGRSEAWARRLLPHLSGKRAFEQWLRTKVALWARYSAC